MPYRPRRNQREAKRQRNAERYAAKDQVARLPYCVDCGTTKDLTMAHLKAVAKGGTVEDGTTTLCRACNARQGTS